MSLGKVEAHGSGTRRGRLSQDRKVLDIVCSLPR